MNREELINLVKVIIDVNSNKSEEEIDALLQTLEDNVPHPAPSDLIYWVDLTPEEIVDRALSYKPIILPPPKKIE
jgi:hypothetical protein